MPTKQQTKDNTLTPKEAERIKQVAPHIEAAQKMAKQGATAAEIADFLDQQWYAKPKDK